MSNLSKTDEKLLEVISPHLDNLQAFVDTHIRGSRAMTAAVIAETFIKEYKCDLDAETLTRAFRIAVRENKIKGIAGARRRGYYRVGEFEKADEDNSDASDTSDVPDVPDVLDPYIEGIQKFVDENIKGDVRMTSPSIYDGFKAGNECALSEEEFVRAFRVAIRDNKIVGLVGARGSGYGRSEPSEEGESTSGCEIIIDEHRKIVALDRLNWGYMTRRSGNWTVDAYFTNTTEMVRSIARKVLDGELKTMGIFDFASLEKKFQESENRIAKLLSRALSGKENSVQELCTGSFEKERCHEV